MPSVVNSWRVEYRRASFGVGEWICTDWRDHFDKADEDLRLILATFPDTDWIIVQKVVETSLRLWKGKNR